MFKLILCHPSCPACPIRPCSSPIPQPQSENASRFSPPCFFGRARMNGSTRDDAGLAHIHRMPRREKIRTRCLVFGAGSGSRPGWAPQIRRIRPSFPVVAADPRPERGGARRGRARERTGRRSADKGQGQYGRCGWGGGNAQVTPRRRSHNQKNAPAGGRAASRGIRRSRLHENHAEGNSII